jgi:hypothetical protein
LLDLTKSGKCQDHPDYDIVRRWRSPEDDDAMNAMHKQMLEDAFTNFQAEQDSQIIKMDELKAKQDEKAN